MSVKQQESVNKKIILLVYKIGRDYIFLQLLRIIRILRWIKSPNWDERKTT